jgi:uncharacterized protein (DUF2147 family)
VIRRISLLLVAALLAATMVVVTAAPAFAVSPSQEQCEAQGGTFTRSGGEVQCVIVEEGKNPKFTEEETTTGQGNISNKQEQQTECEGTGSGKCPPGQF